MNRLPKIVTVFAVVLLPLVTLPAFAAETSEWDDQMVTMPIGNDTYVAGGNPSISAAVEGDLVIAGGNVRVDGPVAGDVLGAGGQVDINGRINDDVRVAGGTVRISGTVAGDVVVMGGTIIIADSARIQGDVVVMGGQIEIGGEIGGKLKVGGGQVRLTGTVARGAEVDAGSFLFNGTVSGESKMVADKLQLGPNARMQGTVNYWTRAGEVDFSTALQGGSGATFDVTLARAEKDVPEAAGVAAGIIGVWSIFSLLSSALVLGLLMLLLPGTFKAAGERAKKSPWMSMLIGFLYLAAAPVLALLLFVTIIGIPLGLFLLVLYVFSIVFSSAIASLVSARWLESRMRARWHPGILFLVAVGVWIVLKLLWLIPIVGWILKFLIMCLALGAVLHSVWTRARPVA